MDDALVAGAIGFLAGRGGAFLDAVLSPTATAAGEDLLAHYRRWTGRNVADALTAAADMLADAGDTPNPVPGRILFPILTYAAVEEDAMLKHKWAALLANAASSTEANRLLPAYAETLRQLTPMQAHILDWLYNMEEDSHIGFPVWPDVSRNDIEAHFKLTPEQYALFISDMDRLQVVEGRRDTKMPQHLKLSDEQLEALVVDRWNSRVKYELVTFTTLGINFMRACSPPRLR